MDCISKEKLSKILIYGRNATGKTNFGKALIDIQAALFGNRWFINDEIFINADSTEDLTTFTYEFEFDNEILIYKYSRFYNKDFKEEELIINGNTIFKCDFNFKSFDFYNLKYINAETANINRDVQSILANDIQEEIQEPHLPFLKWLINNVAIDNDSLLSKLSNYVAKMIMIRAGNGMTRLPRLIRDSFYEFLEEPINLGNLEDFLNAMGIKCKLILKKLPDGQSELYFSHKKLVPFYETASSGTLALVDLYRKLVVNGRQPSFIYLDEFDAFYHYEMAENLIKFFKKQYYNSQIIMTSHNTNLMTNQLMRQDCLFILSSSGTLTSLCNATPRELREGHNLKKMYISGEFNNYE